MGIITITQDGEIYSDQWPASPGQVGAKGLAVGVKGEGTDTYYL